MPVAVIASPAQIRATGPAVVAGVAVVVGVSTEGTVRLNATGIPAAVGAMAPAVNRKSGAATVRPTCCSKYCAVAPVNDTDAPGVVSVKVAGLGKLA